MSAAWRYRGEAEAGRELSETPDGGAGPEGREAEPAGQREKGRDGMSCTCKPVRYVLHRPILHNASWTSYQPTHYELVAHTGDCPLPDEVWARGIRLVPEGVKEAV